MADQLPLADSLFSTTPDQLPSADSLFANDYSPQPVKPTAAFGINRSPSTTQNDPVKDFLANTSYGRVLDALGHGAKENWGEIGLSPKNQTAIATSKLLGGDYEKGEVSFWGAAAESVLNPVVSAWDALQQGTNAVTGGVASAANQAVAEYVPDWLHTMMRLPKQSTDVKSNVLNPEDVSNLLTSTMAVSGFAPLGFGPIAAPKLPSGSTSIETKINPQGLTIASGKPPTEGLVPAYIDLDKQIHYGSKTDTHGDIIPEKDWDKIESNPPTMGFAGPDGNFLSRDEALATLPKDNLARIAAEKENNNPNKYNPNSTGLDATDLWNLSGPAPITRIGDAAALSTMPEDVYMGLKAPDIEQLAPRSDAFQGVVQDAVKAKTPPSIANKVEQGTAEAKAVTEDTVANEIMPPMEEPPVATPGVPEPPAPKTEIKPTEINEPGDLQKATEQISAAQNEIYYKYGPTTRMPSLEGVADATGLSLDEMLMEKNKWFNLDPARSTAIQKAGVDAANEVFDLSQNIQTEADAAKYLAAKQRLEIIQDEVGQIKYNKGLTLKAQQLLPMSKEEQLAADAIAEFTKDNKLEPATTIGADGKVEIDPTKITPEMLKEVQLEAEGVKRLPSPSAVAKAVRNKKKQVQDRWYAKGRNMALEWLYNAMLWSPTTHAANIVGNTITALYRTGETFGTALLGAGRAAFGKADDRVYFGEAPQKIFGLVQGMKEGSKAFTKAMTLEEPTFGTTTARQLENKKAIPGLAGRAVRLPGSAMMAEDEFFKAMGYRASLNAQAYREGKRLGLSQLDGSMSAHIAKRVANPSSSMRKMAIEEANYDTFTKELGKAGKMAEGFLNNFPIMKFLFLPFYKFGTNAFKFIGERTILAPFASAEVRSILRGEKGLAARDEQIVKMAMGTPIVGSALYWASDGRLTGSGPKDPVARKNWLMTHKPNTLRVGDQYYQYNRILGPFAALYTAIADGTYAYKHMNDGERKDVGALWLLAAGNAAKQLPGMNALSDLSDVMDSDNSAHFERWAWGIAARGIPNILGDVAKMNDPYIRDVNSFYDALENKIPTSTTLGVAGRQSLDPVLDVFGQPVENQGQLGPDMISPIAQYTPPNDPVLKAMGDVNYNLAPPSKQVNGVQLSNSQWRDYQVKAGTLTKLSLANLIQVPAFSSIPPQVRKQKMQQIVARSRDIARKMLLAKYPELWNTAIKNKLAIWAPGAE